MRLTQINNSKSESALIEFVDRTIQEYCESTDKSSLKNVKFIAPRNSSEKGLYQIKLTRLLEVSTPLESGETYKIQMRNDSRPFFYRPEYGYLTTVKRFSDEERSEYMRQQQIANEVEPNSAEAKSVDALNNVIASNTKIDEAF